MARTIWSIAAIVSLVHPVEALGQNDVPKALVDPLKNTPAAVNKAVPVAKPKGTKELFNKFYEDYSKAMETVSDQPTTAKKEQTHRELARKLDEDVKGQSWEFHCEIIDVKSGRNDVFEIHIELPLEMPVFNEEWDCRSTVQNVRLSRQQGLALVPGDVLVIRGTPRFSFEIYDENTAFFSRNVRVGERGLHHSIRLTGTKFSIEKKKADAAKQ
jgi:hypothetical protein